MAGLYMTFLTKNGGSASFEKRYPAAEMAEAMHQTVATIIELQIKYFGSDKKPNSLNLCATDGTRLVAYRFRNHAKSQPPSLYYSTKVYHFTLLKISFSFATKLTKATRPEQR
jgi:glutamine amidotransferase